MKRPNILFILSDDHAAHAISAYGSRINQTPALDRIAAGGALVGNCFCTNAICTPSRATILTGQYGHINGVRTWEALDNRRPVQIQKLLQRAGYHTALFGKWHLGHGRTESVWSDNDNGRNAVPADPAGFDDWFVLPGQGDYQDPEFHTPNGKVRLSGYVSDVTTDLALDWLEQQTNDAPFFLCVHHKAPHRPWIPGEKYRHLYHEDLPLPETFADDYQGRPAAAAAKMRILEDLDRGDLKADPPADITPAERKVWNYQRYMKDYLRCVASVDSSAERLLDSLDRKGIAGDTIVIYTSDQGFFLGDHGWYDKRFIYEESLRMPLLIRYPREIPAGSRPEGILTNTDFAPTLLDFAGVAIPAEMQGVSARAVLGGNTVPGWQTSVYYRYWDHGTHHNVCAHYGIRTATHKLVYYCGQARERATASEDPKIDPYWELFDLMRDPGEIHNIYHEPEKAPLIKSLMRELDRQQKHFGDEPLHELRASEDCSSSRS